MSDIPTGPNDKLLITREALDNLNEWVAGYVRLRAILLDLIAEFDKADLGGGYYDEEAVAVQAAFDRAEARLKGLDDE